MGEKVFLLRDADVSGKKLLWDAGLEVVVAKGAGESAWIEEMQRERPAAILTRADRVSAAMMDACPGLKAIGKQGIGLDCIDMDVATQRGIQVVYAPVSNVNAAAEHTMFMIMACARRFSYVDRVFRGGNFDVRYGLHNTFELSGRTLGLIGCGHVGSRVAQKASLGFGIKVIGYDPAMDPEAPPAGIRPAADIEAVFRQADVVSLHLPSTPETRNLVDKHLLRMMKPTASFVNISRGDLVVEEDLIQALEEGWIAGAALDVFRTEPLPPDSPLLAQPGLFLTPHVAAAVEQAVQGSCRAACQGVVEVLTGQPVTWPANHPLPVQE